MIFLTGASGLLGANLAQILVEEGETVRVLVRSHTRDAALRSLGVERVVGDLRDTGSIRSWIRGCDEVIHAAAMVSIREIDKPAMVQANVAATRSLVEAALAEGVERMVHCSSVGTLGQGPQGECDETMPVGPDQDLMFYERTKVHAEMAVLEGAARGLNVCMVNPSAMVGPHDHKPSLIGQTILDFAHGRLPAYVRGGYDFVPVDDAARGVLLALRRGQRGQRYILSGEYVELGTVMAWLSELVGRPAPSLALPPRLMLPLAELKDRTDRWLFPQRYPRFNRHSIRLLQSPKFPSHARARDELGWSVGPARAAFARAVAWFRAEGRLPAAPAGAGLE